MNKVFLILLLGMFMISFSSALLNNDIVSYYKLDNNDFNDLLGLNNATNNGTTNTTGIIIDGRQFSGSNYISTGITTISLPITINTWFKRGTPIGEDMIFSKWDSVSSDGIRFGVGFISSNTDLLINSGTDGTWRTISSSVNTDWHMVTMVLRADGYDTYFDGTITITNQASTMGNNIVDTLYMGGFAPGNGLYVGDIDEFGIWNTSLTTSQISELYNSGNGLSYPFTSQEVTVLLDSPLDNVLISSNVTFNSSLTPYNNSNLTNATLFVWDSDGDLFTTQINIVTGDTLNTTSFIVDNLTSGNYEWNVFGTSENSTGFVFSNFSSSNNTFTWVPFSVDNEEFNINVFETSRQEFLLNITTLPLVLSMDAFLNYNGTLFTADTSCSLGLCQVSTDIDIPLISAGESENKSFFWQVSIFDGIDSFSTNLTSNEQNITRLHLEKCDGTYTVQTLNFTSFDESTEAAVNPFMFDGSFDFWLGTGSIKRNNSISESSISSLQLCLTPSEETFFLDGTIEYDEATDTNYTNRNYFFQNDQISNVSQDIRLGLLLSEDSTSFILKVQDRDILPVANVVIFTERFYPGEGVFKTVQVSQTDDSGGTIGFFKTETVDYRFILKQNGTTVLTTNKQKIIGESVPFTLTFTIGADEGAAWDTFEDIDDLTSSVSFNKTSNIVSFTYADTSGDFTLGRLIVEKVNASGLQNTIICSETSIESSAIITCNLTGNSTGTYIMRGIITRDSDPILVVQEPFAIEDFSMVAGRLGLFLGWFIILISAFAFKFNEVAGIILVNLAMIMVNLFGLISFGYVFISAIIAISIIILVVLER